MGADVYRHCITRPWFAADGFLSKEGRLLLEVAFARFVKDSGADKVLGLIERQ